MPVEDNPTIDRILCSKRNEAIVKYSILNDNKNIFASKYLLYLPTEEELKREIEKERNMMESLKEKDKEWVSGKQLFATEPVLKQAERIAEELVKS